jgi:5-methylcytosine-specific restriction enzyme subunit McrC
LRNVRIINAQERSSLEIPHEYLFDDQGRLKLIPDATDRSLVQVTQGREHMVLQIGGVIGRLPVTESLALDISPKFSISNLARLLALSDQSLDRKVGVDRLYDFTEWTGYLPELLLRSFATELRAMRQEGSHRNYKRVSREDIPKPKLNFRRSEQQFWGRGIPTRAVVEGFDFTLDNPTNRILKAALRRAIPLASGQGSLAEELTVFAESIRSYGLVSDAPRSSIERSFSDALAELPRFKFHHSRAIWIARELIIRSSVVLDFADRRLSLPSYLINLDRVFESYIRNVLRSRLRALRAAFTVQDGNLKGFTKALLNDSERFVVMPDILVFGDGEVAPRMVADVKYKTRPKEEDRYQIIAHSLSHHCRKAMLIYPKRPGGPSGLIRLGNIGPPSFSIDLFEYHFELDGVLEDNENQLVYDAAHLLGNALSARLLKSA